MLTNPSRSLYNGPCRPQTTYDNWSDWLLRVPDRGSSHDRDVRLARANRRPEPRGSTHGRRRLLRLPALLWLRH
jgi:hypothetical protein